MRARDKREPNIVSPEAEDVAIMSLVSGSVVVVILQLVHLVVCDKYYNREQ